MTAPILLSKLKLLLYIPICENLFQPIVHKTVLPWLFPQSYWFCHFIPFIKFTERSFANKHKLK